MSGIKKTNWNQSFSVTGRVGRISDKTWKVDAQSASGYVYNSANLGIVTDDGTVYCQMMGGYSSVSDNNVVYCHGKGDDGRDDFQNRIEVKWDDRFDEDVLSELGDMCFYKFELEQTTNGNMFAKKFISIYDAVAYCAEHLAEGDYVNVTGDISYDEYNGETSIRRNITGIRKVDPEKWASKAGFKQSVYLTSDSVTKDSIDMDNGIVTVNGYVAEYRKEKNGVSIRGNIAVPYTFEYRLNGEKEKWAKQIEYLFKVKKDTIQQVNFAGTFAVEDSTVQPTEEDLSPDLLALVNLGLYTLEELLRKVAGNANRIQHVYLDNIMVKNAMVGEESIPIPAKYEEVFTEDEFFSAGMPVADAWEDEVDDLSWLDSLA